MPLRSLNLDQFSLRPIGNPNFIIRVLALVLPFWSMTAEATHNRGGEITFRQLSGLTFEITVTTYTKDQNAADRPDLPVSFNYGNPVFIDTVPRLSRVFVGADIVRNIYVTTHTFPGPSTYTISVADPNRVANVVNIPFYRPDHHLTDGLCSSLGQEWA